MLLALFELYFAFSLMEYIFPPLSLMRLDRLVKDLVQISMLSGHAASMHMVFIFLPCAYVFRLILGSQELSGMRFTKWKLPTSPLLLEN